MVKVLKEFVRRKGIELCSSEWAYPCFVVLKNLAGEWRMLVDYRDLNLDSQHDA